MIFPLAPGPSPLYHCPMFRQPSSVQFFLPSWIEEFAREYSVVENPAARMAFVIAASRRNAEEKTGGPFAAAIFQKDTGKLVSLGVNLVTPQGLSMLHAEMVAFALAQRRLGTYDLGKKGLAQHELVASSEPCAMCFGAIFWSGVRRVVCAAEDADVRSIGFDEGPKLPHWQETLRSRGIEVVCGTGRQEAAAVLARYAESGGHIYNSREAG
ncbi:MAG: nucleoside deaminase [Rhodocyclaceae bacterium]|nr:nucleoside deaminase [Rhodocyclaceae bacterium]